MPSGPSPRCSPSFTHGAPQLGGVEGGKVRAGRWQPPPPRAAVPNAVLLRDGDDPTGAMNQRAGSAARKP